MRLQAHPSAFSTKKQISRPITAATTSRRALPSRRLQALWAGIS